MKEFDSSNDYVEFYLEKLRSGNFEDAFHSLTDIGYSVVPRLIDAFYNETTPVVRAELVKIIWNHRRPETASFLGEALLDPHPEIWKTALDGLVTLATSRSLEALRTGLNRPLSKKKEADNFRTWVEEAIGQVESQLASNISVDDD